MMFHVVLRPEEDGWIVAECPALPGCVSQGRDEKEALVNIREAITGWLWAEDQKAADSLPAGQMSVLVAVSIPHAYLLQSIVLGRRGYFT